MANIVESKKFIWSEADANHNKVWHVILYDNDDVETRWARVGNEPQSKIFSGVGKSFMDKKIKEKTTKGYSEAKIVDTILPASAPRSAVSVDNLSEIAKSQILKSSGHPILDKLVERLVKSNIHKITSSTNITLNDATGLFQTPIGIVTLDAIKEARDLLADALPYVKKDDYGVQLSKIVSHYLRLIPQNIGMKFNIKNILPDVTSIQKQSGILDALESSYQAITTTKITNKTNDSRPIESIFNVDLDIENGNDASRLERWFETSKKSMHGYNRIKIINIYRIKIHSMNDKFLSSDSNKKEVFHGSSMANVLSILKNGLKINPPSTAAIAGKLFGRGIYGAINSTKSLGYCFNRWGQGGTGDAAFLFVCDFALGKCYSTTTYGCSKPNGYDSIWAKASSGGLHNDELIVYSENRVNPKFILECK